MNRTSGFVEKFEFIKYKKLCTLDVQKVRIRGKI